MKNIIIAGVSRAGKSTIAKNIAKKLNINYIPFDSIVSTVEKFHPGHSIKHYDDTLCASKEVACFLKEFLSHVDYEGIQYIIDIYQIKPKDLKDALDLSKYIVLYIGYPTISLNDKMHAVRKGARPNDWTEDMNDDELAPIIQSFINDSIILYDECLKENMLFFDTSVKFHETINEVTDYILNKYLNNQNIKI